MRRRAIVSVFVLVPAVLGLAWWARNSAPSPPGPLSHQGERGSTDAGRHTPRQAQAVGEPDTNNRTPPVPLIAASEAAAERKEAGKLYRKGRYHQAAERYQEIVRRYAPDPDPETAEEVAHARYLLAYTHAFRKDYATAARLFGECERLYRGTRAKDATLGATLQERAALQGAICLRAMGRKNDSLAAFGRMIHDYPLSPAAHTAARELSTLNGGRLTLAATRDYDHARRLQEKARQEEAVQRAKCGVTCLAYVLKHYGIPAEEKDLLGLCRTGERGTTLQDLARVARAKGLSAVGVSVSEEGLARVPVPSILLLEREHYVVLTRAGDGAPEILDLAQGEERRGPLFSGERKEGWRAHALAIHGRRGVPE